MNVDIVVNETPITWDTDAGKMEFFGVPAVTLRLNPSLLRILEPLRQEVGNDLYYLLVAQHASLGTRQDYYQIVNELGTTFEKGFLAWGDVVAAAGWGSFKLLSFNPDAKTAVVRIHNPWELGLVEESSATLTKLCPFLMGKITGIFTHALGVKCWASEENITIGQAGNVIDLHVKEHHLSFDDEVVKLRALKKLRREKTLEAEIAARVEQQVHAEKECIKLSRAVEQTGESIMITDVEGVIEYVNPSFTRITGYEPHEVLGKNPRILKSGKQTPEYYKKLWSTISSGNTWHSSVIDRRKNGNEYPAMTTISPIMDEQGTITHYVGIQQDISSHQDLERKFIQAQKMEGMGTLVAGVAHDFNNILAAMTGNLYLIKKKVKHLPDVAYKVSAIEKLSFSSAVMIKKLLSFSRNTEVEMKELELTPLIKESLELAQVGIPTNINVNQSICAEELNIKGDASQLQQVLMNLVKNACDAIDSKASPIISVTLEAFTAGESFIKQHFATNTNNFAHIIVSDNGEGISSHHQTRIFEPFYTTKTDGLGTGLGLAMSYGAIQSHGGIIEVDSPVGKGASFHIYLPLLESNTNHLNLEASGDALLGNGELILLVDDDSSILEVNQDILESLGYKVITATDGLDGIDVFMKNKESIQLIFTDVTMPRLSGTDMAEHIQSLCPDIKVIFSSGYDESALADKTILSGYTLLSKPFSIPSLSQALKAQFE